MSSWVRVTSFLSAITVVLFSHTVSPATFAQKVTVGVLAGASLTDDFQSGTYAFGGSTAIHISNASQWFMVGPMLELALPGGLSVEVDAIRQRRRSRSLIVLPEPLVFPNGVTITSYGPFTNSIVSPWQFSLLGKYRIDTRRIRPFVELGYSFLPRENRDQAGIAAGSGAEITLWRLNLAPALRYTRWLKNEDLAPVGPFGAQLVKDQVQLLVGIHEKSTARRPTAFGRPISLGVVAGFGLTKLLRDRFDPVSLSASGSDSITPIAGIQIEIPAGNHFFLEVDGLYRATHNFGLLPGGSNRVSTGSAFLTWEFPILAKYKMLGPKVAPTIELGPSFRAIAHGGSGNDFGVSGGVGVSARAGGLRIAPTLRYTRWRVDKYQLGREVSPATRPNQLELVVGFSF
jgi:hypothetical protein